MFSANAQSTGYVTVDCNNFYINGTAYRPLVINYTIDYANVNSACTAYYASPYWGYSNGITWAQPPANGMPCVNPMGWVGRPSYQGAGPEQTTATNKLYSDFLKIKQMGFNTIRVFTSREYHPAMGGFYNRAGNLTNDFSVVDALLLAVRNHNLINNDNLKVILMMGRSSNCTPSSPTNCSKGEWDDFLGFKTYIEAFANRYKLYPEVMAYDLYNEPDQTAWSQYHYNSSLPNDKYKISNWITEWYYSIKKFDPNHLVTIGLTGSEFTLGWDPNTMPIDFVSFHYYSYSSSVSISNDRIGSYLYYAAKNITKPWIIGETGYSGSSAPTVTDPIIGSEANQKTFAALTLQRSVDCGCKGYSWWQYQDVEWGDWQNYLGLIDQYGLHGANVEGYDKDIVDASLPSPPFNGYAALNSNASACAPPASYYNPNSYPATSWVSTVKNELNQPIPNAYVLMMANSSTLEIKTYTDNSGNFRIYCPAGTVFSKIRISAPGYNTLDSYTTPNGATYNITKINYNDWTKKWTNNTNNYIGSWGINDLDKFYNLDYDGDGKDDLLCLQNHGGNYDWATMLYYNNANADWSQAWTNSGSDWIGGWHQQIAYNDRFVTGDFNFDGKDDLLSMQVFGSGDWCTLQKFVSGSWSVLNTNSGNDYIGPWKIETTDEFKSGDFNGDGKDDLLCIRKTSGSADLFSILNYNPSTNTWGYLYVAGNPMTNWGSDFMGGWAINPIDKYYIGDFNGDGKDDILSAQCTTGSGDWMMLQTLNTSTGVFDPPLWTNSGSSSPAIYPYRNNLIIGNFDEDVNKEILGFSTLASKFDFSSGSFNSSWSTGSSARFSDWYVVSSTPNYRFIKTNKYSPEQLLVFKKYSANYLVNMYSFNRISDCPTTRSMIANEEDNNSAAVSEELDFALYPNPTSGNFAVSLNQDNYINAFVFIYTIHGEVVKKINLNGLESGTQTLEVSMDELSSGIYFITFSNNNKTITKKISCIK